MDQDTRKRAEEILLASAYSSSTRPPDSHRWKKKKFFSPEEKTKILNRVKTVGVTQAAQEAGTWPDLVRRWLDDLDKIVTEIENDLIQEKEEDNMKKTNDFTPEEREAIVARAREIGAVKAAQEAGTNHYVVAGWMKKKPTAIIPERDSLPEKVTVTPGQNGLPAKRDNPKDYTPEERKIIVAKADEVGNPPVKAAYGFKSNYVIHDWRRALARQAKRAEKEAAKAQTQAIKPVDKTSLLDKTVIIPEAPEVPKTPPSPVANYPLEVEVILLREKVADLTRQIERMRTVVSTLI